MKKNQTSKETLTKINDLANAAKMGGGGQTVPPSKATNSKGANTTNLGGGGQTVPPKGS